MLLDDVAQYLIDNGVSVPVQKGQMVETPDEVVALRETGGFPPEHFMGSSPVPSVQDQPTVQVLTRARDYLTAMAGCRNVYQLLNGAANYVLTGTQRFGFVSAMQPPFFLMRDENHRFICAFNIHIQRQSSVA
jgi:hypothetical protein